MTGDSSMPILDATPKGHIWLIYLYCFLVFMDWSIIVPSVMPYLVSLGDSEAAAAYHFAWAQTIFAVAQFMVSLVAGIAMLKLGSFKVLFLISACLLAIGNFLYAIADSSVTGSIPLLLVGRFLAGAGAGGNSVGFAYVGVVCTDKKVFVATLGRYRTCGVVATVLGATIAGVFSFFDFTVAGLHCYSATLPGLFTTVCFILWGVACAILIKAKPPTSQVAKAFRNDAKVMYWFVTLLLSSLTGATIIYCMPTIMHGYGWGAGTQSLFFTVASIGTLIGSLIGQEKKVIFFDMKTRSFNGYPVAMAGVTILLVSMCLFLLSDNLQDGLVTHIIFVGGATIGCGGFSLLNNIGGSCLMLTFTEAEKLGMSPFTGGAVAFGKIAAPLLADAGVQIAKNVNMQDWTLVFGFWLLLSIGVLLILHVQKAALRTSPPPKSTGLDSA